MSISSQQNAILELLVKNSTSLKKAYDPDVAIVLTVGSKLCKKAEKKLRHRFGKSFDAQFLTDLRDLEAAGLIRIAILDPTCSIVHLTKLGLEHVQQRRESSKKDIHWWGAFADAINLPLSILAIILAMLGLIGITISVKNCNSEVLVPGSSPISLPPQPGVHTPGIPAATSTVEQQEPASPRSLKTPTITPTITLTSTITITPVITPNSRSPSVMQIANISRSR